MSFICRVLIGYFDATEACRPGRVVPSKPLGADQVTRLQAACDELFDIKVRLIDYLTEDGLIRITSRLVNEDQYRVACIAQELFGMSAIDQAHRCMICPPEWGDIPDIESLVSHWRSVRPNWDEERVRAQAETTHSWIVSQRNFERETLDRVRMFAGRWRYLA